MEEIGFSHIDKKGRPKIVDISEKKETFRKAIASCKIIMKKETLKLIKERKTKKGDVLSVAVIGGIQGAKKTDEIILLSHPLNIEGCDVRFFFEEDGIRIEQEVWFCGKTGPEMEALVGCALSALNIYDMCKAVDREMVISDIRLISKKGGKTDYKMQNSKCKMQN
ncbi:MAG: cyclic pyranopterin monophosphate synthase MoaC [bacterium]